MTKQAIITWTDETEAPRFSLKVIHHDDHYEEEDFGKFKNLPNLLTAVGFILMEMIEPPASCLCGMAQDNARCPRCSVGRIERGDSAASPHPAGVGGEMLLYPPFLRVEPRKD